MRRQTWALCLSAATLAGLGCSHPDAGSPPGGSVGQASDDLAQEPSHKPLIGQPAAEIAVDRWVNGEPATLADLKGRVVLIDFWAVWCGPCIATFPHVTEWVDRYGDQGLVILGLTNYCQYGFDDATGQATRIGGLPPEEERDALQRFAKHHGLKHRLGYLKTNESGDAATDQQYAVNGIPQMVLIDRAGTVRMIRVGSGNENARALEGMIARLLEESPQTP